MKYAILALILAVPAAAQDRAAEIDFQNRLQDSEMWVIERFCEGARIGGYG